MRKTKNIIALLVLLVAAGLMSASGLAASPPQDAGKQDDTARAKRNAETTSAEDSKETRNAAAAEHEFSATSRHGVRRLASDFLLDQKEIWTSPAKLRLSDTEWLVPLSGITAGLFVTDQDFSKHLSQNPTTISHYKTLSNAGVGALIGGGAGMWLLGHASHNEHWSETGFLAGEAAINSLVMVEGMKYSLRRERPYQADGSGPFFQGGGTSFPSEHAAAAWSVAGVVAHEYPGPFPKILAYGLASLVDISRVKAHQHFPSDVLVGSMIGNLVAQNIYSRHHDPELGGEAWRSISQIFRDESHSPANQGSPYVPLDSWIYPALDRLAAMGLIDSGFAGMKPWTRSECARLLNEAGEHLGEVGGSEAEKLYRLLEKEFRTELEGADRERPRAQVESVYARVTNISGQPLTDGNHFGQTITNDFGRPYQEGFNSVDGISAWTTSGRWASYVRAEYQRAPWAPAESSTVRQFIGSVDSVQNIPLILPATPFPAVNQVQLLDAYVGLTFDNWQLSFGKQSLWWSPMQSGPLMFSDNAEPINMFRISRVSPFQLPSVLGWVGPIRMEWFLGQLTGHDFVFHNNTGLFGQFGQPLGRQPFLQGQKLAFKPTPNFEFSVSVTVVFAGGPDPLTFHNFVKSYSIGQGSTNGVTGYFGPGDPGDRRSGVDFTYKLPKLGNWLTFYGDAFTEDEFSPLGYPRKSAFQGGLYIPRIPGVSKLDLRLEGGTTAPVDFAGGCVGCFYVNGRYPGGSYLNGGNLIGSWLGRGGQGERAWSTYWFSPRNKIQFSYRHQKVDGDYLPQGGTLNDGGVNLEFQVRPAVTLSGSLQYEKWNYPLIAPEAKSNWATSMGVTFWPHLWK